jgi:hypothetical protein
MENLDTKKCENKAFAGYGGRQNIFFCEVFMKKRKLFVRYRQNKRL